ncbi:MAG: hypothetical protein IPN20_23775 [Haliscomenobacter sp.]|nr:hypothetical protein [Haliscomenobacter sp.]
MAEPIFLHFIKPGLQTTVQDGGRPGFQAYGVPVSGALDPESARAANELVGNDPGGPVLEIPLLGPEIRFEGAAQIALTGADLDARLDGAPAPRYATLRVREGQTLAFGKPVHGCRAYLAVGGTWMVRSWLHSASATPFATEALTPIASFAKGAGSLFSPTPGLNPKPGPKSYCPIGAGLPASRSCPGRNSSAFRPWPSPIFSAGRTASPPIQPHGLPLSGPPAGHPFPVFNGNHLLRHRTRNHPDHPLRPSHPPAGRRPNHRRLRPHRCRPRFRTRPPGASQAGGWGLVSGGGVKKLRSCEVTKLRGCEASCCGALFAEILRFRAELSAGPLTGAPQG